MKRFLAYWVVSLVLAAMSGWLVGAIEYLMAPTVEAGWRPGTCLDTVLGGCIFDPIDIFYLYPLSAFGMMIVAYPIFRAVVGSFKVVFSG